MVVTGSAQGIGRSMARAFVKDGYRLVVADRNLAKARDVAAECRSDGGQAMAAEVDVADPGSVENMVALTVQEFGRIDVLINNAALFSTLPMQPFDDISPEDWDAVIRVNLTGVFLCCRAAAKHMRAQRSGTIVNMSSATVLFGRPHYLHYVASKSGVIGLTRALARELGEYDVTVNAILPGSVATEIERASVTSTQADAIVAAQSVHRRLVSDDIVGTALFLASPAARRISGQSLVVDGGANFV